MTRGARVLLVGLLLGLMAGSALAQIDDDPSIQRIKDRLRELGGGGQLSRDGAFLEAQARWGAQGAEIARAVEEQNEALAGSTADLDRCRTLYASRVESRGTAVDHYLYGRLLGLTGNLDEAYQHFRRALEADNFLFWAWDGVGVYHLNRERWELAREAFSRCLQLKPDYRKAAFGMVDAYVQEGNLGRAASRLNEILVGEGGELDPDVEKQARLHLAQVYRQQRDYARCVEELDWLVAQGVQEYGVFAMRAFCLALLERYADAVRDYRKMLELDPEDFRVHFFLARCHSALGHNAEAAEAYDKGLVKGAADIPPDRREALEAERDRLRKLPAVSDPQTRQLGLPEWIDRLHHSTDPKRRREAAILLSEAPARLANVDATRQLISAFSRGVKDKDPVVATKCLEQVVLRLAGTQMQSTTLDLIEVILREKSDPTVRGMACHLLRLWDKSVAVPLLVRELRRETDPYVVDRIHESLNTLTLAWIERVPPDSLRPEDVTRLRGLWREWYLRNRDVFRKNEPQGFEP